MPRGHSLVPGLKTRCFHAAVRDECDPEAAGVGVERGRRHLPTDPAGSQVGRDEGVCPAIRKLAWALRLFPEPLEWCQYDLKGCFNFLESSDLPGPCTSSPTALVNRKDRRRSILQIRKLRSERRSVLS